jgi:hypothetical protein
MSRNQRVIARACIAALCAVLAGGVSAATEYADRTDKQLTELAANWENLSEDERRALLTEIKARMHSSAGKVPVLTIKTERRYGRIVRQSDGSLVRIETTQQHTIRYRPQLDAADQPFGVGFEQRSTTAEAGNVPNLPPSSAASTAASSPSPTHANAIPVVPVGHAEQP